MSLLPLGIVAASGAGGVLEGPPLEFFYVASGANSQTSMARSADGITWSTVSVPSGNYHDMAYGNGILLMTSINGVNLVRSTDQGQTIETGLTAPISGYNYLGYDSKYQVFLSFPISGSVVYSSADGSSWTPVTGFSVPSSFTENIVGLNNRVYAFIYPGSMLVGEMTSATTVNQISTTNPLSNSRPKHIVWDGDRYIVVGWDGAGVSVSTDGTNWTPLSVTSYASTTRGFWRAAVGHLGTLISIESANNPYGPINQAVLLPFGSTTLQTLSLPTTALWTETYYTNGTYYLRGYDPASGNVILLRSTDLVTWQSSTVYTIGANIAGFAGLGATTV